MRVVTGVRLRCVPGGVKVGQSLDGSLRPSIIVAARVHVAFAGFQKLRFCFREPLHRGEHAPVLSQRRQTEGVRWSKLGSDAADRLGAQRFGFL